MPNRIIREGILTSEAVNSLTWEAEVFYRRLLSVVDDYGRYDARISVLRASLYPTKLEKMRDGSVQRCLKSCEAARLLVVYEVDGKQYLQVTKFNQTIRSKTSRWPAPTAEPKQKASRGPLATLIAPGEKEVTPDHAKQSQSTQHTTNNHMHSTCIADDTHMHSTCIADAQQMISKTKAKTKTKNNEPPSTTNVTPPKAEPPSHTPPQLEDIIHYISNLPERPQTTDTITRCAASFYDTYAARGWRDTRDLPLRDWRPAARKYARSWAINDLAQTNNHKHQPTKSGQLNANRNYEL